MEQWFTVPWHPEYFSYFCQAGFLAGFLIVLHYGWRHKFPLIPWLVVMASGRVLGIVGSKLLMIPLSRWGSALLQGSLPACSEKSFLGGALFGLLAVLLIGRLMGFRKGIVDAYALALPIGLAVGRPGCFFGGCCFGTPSNLPWAVVYPAGAPAWQEQLAQGLIRPGAAISLPVHPVQLYDMVLMVAVAIVLLAIRRRLKRPASLLCLSAALYCVARFGEEMVRAGGVNVGGLKVVQWAMLIVAAGAIGLLVVRERRPATRSQPAAVRDWWPRNLAVVLGLLGLTWLGRDWFTPVEMTAITVMIVPMLAIVLIQAASFTTAHFTRRATLFSAIAALILLGARSDSLPSADTTRGNFLNVSVGGTAGEYTEVDLCNGYRTTYGYGMAGAGISRTNRFSRDLKLEYGLRGYIGSQAGSPDIAGLNPYTEFDWRWVGIGLGVHLRPNLSRLDSLYKYPSLRLRLGPPDIVFVEANFFDLEPGPAGPLPVLLCLGHELGEFATLRIGIAGSGFFASPEFNPAPDWTVRPFVAYGNDWQVGLNIRHSFRER